MLNEQLTFDYECKETSNRPEKRGIKRGLAHWVSDEEDEAFTKRNKAMRYRHDETEKSASICAIDALTETDHNKTGRTKCHCGSNKCRGWLPFSLA